MNSDESSLDRMTEYINNTEKKIYGAAIDFITPYPGGPTTQVHNPTTPALMNRYFVNGVMVNATVPAVHGPTLPIPGFVPPPMAIPQLSTATFNVPVSIPGLGVPPQRGPMVTIVKNAYGVPEIVVSPSLGTININVNDIMNQYGINSGFDLNRDKDVQYKMAKYIRYKILDKWLYRELNSLLGYLIIKGGKVELVDDVKQYKSPEDDSEEVTERKVKYMEDNIIDFINILLLLGAFVKKYDVKWYYLNKYDELLIPEIGKYVKKMIETKISQKH